MVRVIVRIMVRVSDVDRATKLLGLGRGHDRFRVRGMVSLGQWLRL